MSEIKDKITRKEDLTQAEITRFLDYVIKSVRTIINDEKMTNKCDIAQGIIGRYLDGLNIKTIYCSTLKQIGKTTTGHSFLLANFNDNLYLIDPAYVQFKYDKTKDLYIKGLKCKSYSPYHYAQIINKEACDNLINKGYMPLTEENAFWYGNSFNKTKTNIPSDIEITEINGNTFIRSFLNGNEIPTRYDEYEEISELERNKR